MVLTENVIQISVIPPICVANPSSILDGLIAYWSFNETVTGTVRDYSERYFKGTISKVVIGSRTLNSTEISAPYKLNNAGTQIN